MILITGASGFVGQHLVRYLSAHTQEPIRALYHSHAPGAALLALPHVSWMKCNLLDIYDVETAMEGISDIYHCAAIVSFNPRKKEEMIHFNTTSTAHIVDQALEQDVRKLVYISSIAALGRNEDEKKEITEAEEWEESRYNSAYGQSKYLAEMEVWRGAGEGLHVAIVNPGIIIGEGDWNHGSSNLLKVAYKEFPFYTEGVNAWVDVKDVVTAMYMLMHSDIEAERFIMSAGNYSYRDIFTMMSQGLGKKPPHIKANSLMTGLVWRWNMLKTLLLGRTATITKETASNAQRRCYYNNEKLIHWLPSFRYTPIEDAITRSCRAFLTEVDK